MTWVRIDDRFNEHPKLAAVGPVGWGIWIAGLAYCNRNLTDGFIPRAIAIGFGGDWTLLVRPEPGDPNPDRELVWTIDRGTGAHGESMDTQWIIDRLVDNDLWNETPGGYLVHDYSDYQPTKAEVLQQRAQKEAAGRAGGIAAARARAMADGTAEGLAKPKQNRTPNPSPYPKDSRNPTPAGAYAREGNGQPQSFMGWRPNMEAIEAQHEADRERAAEQRRKRESEAK